MKKDFEKFTLGWFLVKLHWGWKRRIKVLHVLMTVFIHLHFSLPTSTSTSLIIYSELWLGKHVECKIYINKSRVEISNEKYLNQLEILKNHRRYHVSKMPFDTNMAESYWHGLDWCNFSWAVTPGDVLKGLAQNMLVDHKIKFHSEAIAHV